MAEYDYWLSSESRYEMALISHIPQLMLRLTLAAHWDIFSMSYLIGKDTSIDVVTWRPNYSFDGVRYFIST